MIGELVIKSLLLFRQRCEKRPDEDEKKFKTCEIFVVVVVFLWNRTALNFMNDKEPAVEKKSY